MPGDNIHIYSSLIPPKPSRLKRVLAAGGGLGLAALSTSLLGAAAPGVTSLASMFAPLTAAQWIGNAMPLAGGLATQWGANKLVPDAYKAPFNLGSLAGTLGVMPLMHTTAGQTFTNDVSRGFTKFADNLIQGSAPTTPAAVGEQFDALKSKSLMVSPPSSNAHAAYELMVKSLWEKFPELQKTMSNYRPQNDLGGWINNFINEAKNTATQASWEGGQKLALGDQPFNWNPQAWKNEFFNASKLAIPSLNVTAGEASGMPESTPIPEALYNDAFRALVLAAGTTDPEELNRIIGAGWEKGSIPHTIISGLGDKNTTLNALKQYSQDYNAKQNLRYNTTGEIIKDQGRQYNPTYADTVNEINKGQFRGKRISTLDDYDLFNEKINPYSRNSTEHLTPFQSEALEQILGKTVGEDLIPYLRGMTIPAGTKFDKSAEDTLSNALATGDLSNLTMPAEVEDKIKGIMQGGFQGYADKHPFETLPTEGAWRQKMGAQAHRPYGVRNRDLAGLVNQNYKTMAEALKKINSFNPREFPSIRRTIVPNINFDAVNAKNKEHYFQSHLDNLYSALEKEYGNAPRIRDLLEQFDKPGFHLKYKFPELEKTVATSPKTKQMARKLIG